MQKNLPKQVKIVEVGPRDGLQNEHAQVSSSAKMQLIETLVAAGLAHIEIGSFVSPKWIPQMADTVVVAQGLHVPANVHLTALVPNDKGYELACQSGLKEIALFMSATETHNKKNINKSTKEALDTVSKLAHRAKQDGLATRCHLSVVFTCPYEGKTDSNVVSELTDRLIQAGVDELVLCDTIGAATPADVWKILELINQYCNISQIALHFHDTRGTALANVLAGLEAGINIFDSSVGGMGGCPYAPGAAGNLATEDLVYMLDGMGIQTGVKLEKLVEAGQLAQNLVKRKLPGRYLQAYLATHTGGKTSDNERSI